MKKNKFFKYAGFLSMLAAVLLSSCVEEDFDMPPESTLPVGENFTIQELKDLAVNEEYVFTDSASVYGVVTMDDKLGNLYKTAFIQDETGAIAIHQDGYGGVYQGDSIRVYLKDLKIGQYNQLYQIDAPDGEGFLLDSHVVKLDVNVNIEPKHVTITDLKQYDGFIPAYQGQFVKLTDVQFIAKDTAKTFADTVNTDGIPRSISLVNTKGETIPVSTSDFSSFAGESVPNGSGTFIGILSQYKEELQLLVRTPQELKMNNERFFAYVETFDDFSFGDWTTYSVTGSQSWEVSDYDWTTPHASISGYDFSSGNNVINEDWLISPAFNMNKSDNEVLKFLNASKYSGANIQVKYSIDYPGNGENPKNYTWNKLSDYELDETTSDYIDTESGAIDLSGIFSTSVHIAFIYNSSSDSGKTWKIDNIRIIGD